MFFVGKGGKYQDSDSSADDDDNQNDFVIFSCTENDDDNYNEMIECKTEIKIKQQGYFCD